VCYIVVLLCNITLKYYTVTLYQGNKYPPGKTQLMKKTLSTLIIAIASAMSASHAQADDLLSVYQQAMTNDPVVLKAQAQYMATKEGIDQARAILLPQISLSGQYTDRESEQSSYFGDSIIDYTVESDNSSYSANLNMQLYRHDSWLRMDNAKKAAHRSDISFQLAKQDLIVRVTQAYFDILSAQDDLQFTISEKKAIERQLEQTKQRFSVGLTAITDVHEAQAQYDNAVTSQIRAENSVFTTEEALRVITNVYPRNINILNTEKFSTTRPTPDSANEWQTTAEAKSLNLIFQKIGIDIAKENINIARAGHYPTLDLSGSYGASKSSSSFSLGGQDIVNDTPYLDNQSIGISINVPIYSGGATSSLVRQAQQNYIAASQDLQLTHRDTVRITRNSYNTVIATISAIKSLEQSVLSAEKALEATEAGFEVGTRTIVDVLNSTRNLYNAKRNLSQTRYGYILNILTLKRAAGIITEEDLSSINQGLMAAK